MRLFLYIRKYFRHSKHSYRMERAVTIDSADELDVYLDALTEGK